MQVRANLPKLIEAVRNSGQTVTWVCDPMHGNTESVACYKTRRFDNIRAEVRRLLSTRNHCSHYVHAAFECANALTSWWRWGLQALAPYVTAT